MGKVRVAGFSVSLDGFGAGPGQSLHHPMGEGGMALHEWVLPTQVFQTRVLGGDGSAGSTGVDNEFAQQGFAGLGAWILGRNMFGPVRGPWQGDDWRGWWGDTPPYHCPVFVLTHHAREPLVMQGGTTFHFVTGGIHEALARAREAAAGQDVRLGGGPALVRQYLREGLVDELHLVCAPVLLGRGEPLLAGLDLVSLGYRCTRQVAGDRATHVLLHKA